MLEELEQRPVGPVQVLDDEDARPPCGHRLEEPPPGGEGLLATGRPTVARGADQWVQPGDEPRALGLLREQPRHHRFELRRGLALIVRLEDPGLGLHDLPERPEGDPLAVRQATSVPPGDQVGPFVERGSQLGDEAALADPRLADDGHELDRGLALGAEERLEQQRPLVLAPDERRLRRRLGLPDSRASTDGPPHGDRRRLALGDHRGERLELDRAAGRAHRRLVDDHCSDRSRALEASGRVDDVACDHSLAAFRPRPERDDRLSGRDRRAHSNLEPLPAELLDRVQDPERRAHGSLGVVLVRDRRAEDRHHRVADELLDRAAEALDVRLDALVVRTERRPDVLGIRAVRAVGEPDGVHEEHGYDLPLLACHDGCGERLPAGETELGAIRVLLAAGRTGDHGARHAAGLLHGGEQLVDGDQRQRLELCAPPRPEGDRDLGDGQVVGRLDDVHEVVLAEGGPLVEHLRPHLLDVAVDLTQSTGIRVQRLHSLFRQRRQHQVDRHLAPLLAFRASVTEHPGRRTGARRR